MHFDQLGILKDYMSILLKLTIEDSDDDGDLNQTDKAAAPAHSDDPSDEETNPSLPGLCSSCRPSA